MAYDCRLESEQHTAQLLKKLSRIVEKKNPMAESGDGAGQPFESLPDEMIVHVLSFVDADTLLSCRLVCKQWRDLVDAYAFQEKAARENDWVNNGRGYRSFSQIDTNTVRKLDLSWYVFYTICKYDPFNRNLLKNHCGQSKSEQKKNTLLD